jgi:hypothetical protein
MPRPRRPDRPGSRLFRALAAQGIAEKVGAPLDADERRVKADPERFKSFIGARGGETGAGRGDVPRPD